MTTEVRAYPNYGARFNLTVHDTEVPTFEGRLALRLVEHFGIVSCTDAGEDSTGRHQLRLMEPQDLVTRACEIAELMTRALRVREWIIEAPAVDECEKLALAHQKREREKA